MPSGPIWSSWTRSRTRDLAPMRPPTAPPEPLRNNRRGDHGFNVERRDAEPTARHLHRPGPQATAVLRRSRLALDVRSSRTANPSPLTRDATPLDASSERAALPGACSFASMRRWVIWPRVDGGEPIVRGARPAGSRASAPACTATGTHRGGETAGQSSGRRSCFGSRTRR